MKIGRPRSRHALPPVARIAGAAALGAVLLTACSAGTEVSPGPAAPAVPVPAPPVTGESDSASPNPAATPSARVIEVTYAGGEITGVGPRVEVRQGEAVVLRVTSDVVEEIHVHGYDLYADLVPGQTAEVAFTADLPGAYEVELHEIGRPLFQLRVS